MDPQQQFCLKWNSYSSNLAMTFSNLFKSELLADVTLFCGGKSLSENFLFYILIFVVTSFFRPPPHWMCLDSVQPKFCSAFFVCHSIHSFTL